jgi:hypothetical protein
VEAGTADCVARRRAVFKGLDYVTALSPKRNRRSACGLRTVIGVIVVISDDLR